MERLVGDPNEVEIRVEGKRMTALLDTGSMISTPSTTKASCLGLQSHTFDSILQVEGAGDNLLRYLGYAEATVRVPLLQNYSVDLLLLVVLDTGTTVVFQFCLEQIFYNLWQKKL